MKNREYSINFKDYEDKTIILKDESERVRFVKHLYENFGCAYFLESSLVGSGKMVRNNHLLPTPKGLVKAKEVCEGDYLFSREGLPTKVLKVFPHTNKSIYRVSFDDGTSVDCCDEHLWGVFDGKVSKPADRRKLVTKSTRELIYLGLRGYKNQKRWSIPLTSPVQYNQKELPIDPYTLGLWLGDGTKCNGQITSKKDDLLFYKQQIPYRTSDVYKSGQTINVEGLIGMLRNTKLYRLESLEILNQYKESSVNQRLSLLQGLMDTDGSAGSQATFCNTVKEIAYLVLELARSLGLKASISKNESKLYGVRYKDRYRVRIRDTRGDLFRLPRKLKKQYKKHQLTNFRKYITSIEYVGIDDGVCFAVDNPEKLFLCGGYDYTVTHNSYWWSRISASDLFTGINIEDTKTIFVLKQKFQYNIKELDRSYTPFMTRHQGLVADKVAKNIDGSPVIRNAKKGETPDIPSNCFRASEIYKSRGANLELELCGRRCPKYKKCTEGVGDGYGALYQMQHSITSPKIKMASKTLTENVITKEFTLVVIDEASDIMQPITTLKFTRDDVSRTSDALGQIASSKILVDDYDIEFDEDFDGEEFKDELSYTPPNDEEFDSMLKFVREIGELMDSCDKPYGYDTYDFYTKFSKYKPEAETLLARFSYYYSHIEGMLNDERVTNALIEESDKFWSEPLLQTIAGTKVAGININKKSMTFDIYDDTKHKAFEKAAVVMFLDATSSADELELMFGLDNIVEFKVDPEIYRKMENGHKISIVHHNNVQIHHVTDAPNIVNRSSQKDVAVIEQIKEKLKTEYGESIGFILPKKYAKEGDLRHFIEGRGSNAFQEKEVVAILSAPRLNLGGCLSLYCAYTNSIVQTRNSDFGKYYKFKEQSEILQEIGRLRYNRRPEEDLLCYIVGVKKTDFLEKLGFRVQKIEKDSILTLM